MKAVQGWAQLLRCQGRNRSEALTPNRLEQRSYVEDRVTEGHRCDLALCSIQCPYAHTEVPSQRFGSL